MKELLLKIATLIYGAAIKLRHVLFDINLLRSEKFDIPIICVGNITVGGTGKTPTVEMLVEHYSQSYNVAILSRGYGRISKGYRVVNADDNYRQVGDEPLQMKLKFPNAVVVVCEKRTFAIHRIREEFPDVDMIIMDDGFQHRYVEALVNIVIEDFSRPIEHDNLLPYGQLRDTKSSLYRANYFIVTKCPDSMKPINMRERRNWLIKKASQEIFFSRVKPEQPRPVFAGVDATVAPGAKVIAMAGLGDNDAYYKELSQRYEVVATLDFEDHHIYRMSDLKRMVDTLEEHPDAVIMTTEKDAVKLANSSAITGKVRSKMFYERIVMYFVEQNVTDLFDRIDCDIAGWRRMNNRKNSKSDGSYIRGLYSNSEGDK